MTLLTVFSQHPDLFVACMGVLGLLVGSFLNVVIHRLPLMMEHAWRAECRSILGGEEDGSRVAEPLNLVTPRSRCPTCGTPIAAYENVPLLSYLALQGRCRHCGARISARYPAVEFAAGVAGACAAWHFVPVAAPLTMAVIAKSFAGAAYVWALLALAVIDFDTQLLPDSITLPLLWAGIALGFTGFFARDLEASVLGAMAGYLSLWSIYWLFRLTTGKEGMGYGDFKLLAALGAWLGWQSLPAVILIASALGAVLGVALIALGVTRREQAIPFGPYLALGGIVALFWGDGLAHLLRASGVH